MRVKLLTRILLSPHFNTAQVMDIHPGFCGIHHFFQIPLEFLSEYYLWHIKFLFPCSEILG